MSDGISTNMTSNVHHTVQNQNENQDDLKDVSHQFMYLDSGVTHRAETVIKRGQSEYICDYFSNNSEVMMLEFRTIMLALKSRMYSMSPGKAQGMNDRFSLHSPYFAFHSVRVSQID